jgi:transposase
MERESTPVTYCAGARTPAGKRVCRLWTHPGIGLLTGLALVHTLCPVDRFANSRKVTAYVGLEPRDYSSGERKRWVGRLSGIQGSWC